MERPDDKENQQSIYDNKEKNQQESDALFLKLQQQEKKVKTAESYFYEHISDKFAAKRMHIKSAFWLKIYSMPGNGKKQKMKPTVRLKLLQVKNG